jgi:ribosomal protein L4
MLSFSNPQHYFFITTLNSTEAFEPEGMEELLDDVVTRLFEDARVAYGRTSARGEKYSIEETYREYIHWFDMPWEG